MKIEQPMQRVIDGFSLNPLLLQQINQTGRDLEQLPADLLPLLEAVSRSYDQFEADNQLIPRGRDLDAHEIQRTNKQLLDEAEQLERSDDLFRLVAHASCDLIFELDLHTLKIRWMGDVNPGYGYHLGDLPTDQRTWLELIHEADRSRVEQTNEQFSADGSFFDCEYRMDFKNGVQARWRVRSSLLRDRAGKPIRCIGAVSDTTAERLAHQELLASQATLSALVESTEDAIWSVDNELRFTAFNEAYSKRYELLNGRKPQIGMSFSDRFDQKERSEFEVLRHRVLAGERFTIETSLTHDGEEIVFDFSFNPIVTKGKITGIVVISRNITTRKKLEADLISTKNKAEEMDRLKSSFLANMSHEIRTPLTAILGFSEELTESLSDSELRSYAEVIHRGGTRLLTTINGILDLAQVEAGPVKLNLDQLDVAEKCQRVVELLQPLALEKGLQLVLDPADSSVFTIADAHALTRVLTNVVGNAIKFTANGSVTLRVFPGEEQACIEVHDTGIGIAPEFIPNVFEKFNQESWGYARTHEGTGLGLAIAKELVEQMSGNISVSSERSKGSCFTIRLPLAQSQAVARVMRNPAPPLSAVATKVQGIMPVVLLVEDSPAAIALIRRQLSGVCKLDVASTASGALELCQQQPYDVVLMDLNLGSGPSGLDATRWIRELPTMATARIIILTAFTMNEDRENAFAAGCTSFLPKPFTKNALISAIQLGDQSPTLASAA